MPQSNAPIVPSMDVDRVHDLVYVALRHTPVHQSRPVAENVVLDLDAAGTVVGIEVLDATGVRVAADEGTIDFSKGVRNPYAARMINAYVLQEDDLRRLVFIASHAYGKALLEGLTIQDAEVIRKAALDSAIAGLSKEVPSEGK